MATPFQHVTIAPGLAISAEIQTLPSGYVARMDNKGKTVFVLNKTAHLVLGALQSSCDLETLRLRIKGEPGIPVPPELVLKAVVELEAAGLVVSANLGSDAIAKLSPSLLELLARSSGYPIPAVLSMKVISDAKRSWLPG